MSKFYGNNLSLQSDDLGMTIATVDNAKSATDTWIPPDSRNSTDVLINPIKPRLRSQLLAALMACWICLASGASLGYFTTAFTSLQQPGSRLSITDEQGTWIASLVMLGAMCGGLLSGPCISIGRKKALWIVSGPLTLAWILIATAPNVLLLYIAHIIFGICLGISTDATQLYVSESASAQWRGALGCIPTLMFNIGILICNVAGAWLDWEEMAIFGAVLTLPALLLPYIIPETPSFLVAKGYSEQANAALYWLRGKDSDISAEYEELINCEKGPRLMERIKDLGKCEILQPLLLTCAIRALSRFCGLRAILSYIQIILSQSQSSIDIKWGTVITGTVQLFATLIACLLLDRLGRRILIIGSQLVMGLSLVGLGFYLFYKNDLEGNHGSFLGWIPIAAIIVYIVANAIGLSPASGILIGELIPQRHRSIASSITGSVSWLSAFVVTKTFLDIQQGLHLYGAIWLYGCVCLVGVPFVFFCLPETRGISQCGIEVLFKHSTKVKTSTEESMKSSGVKEVVLVVNDLVPSNCSDDGQSSHDDTQSTHTERSSIT